MRGFSGRRAYAPGVLIGASMVFGAMILGAMILGATVFGAASASPLHDENPPAEYRMLPYSGVVPPCDDPDVLQEISQRFQSREMWFWNSPLAIVRFESVGETGYRTNGASYIPRRYCRASALFSDGRQRRVVYNIAEDTGLLGVTRGVTWCVVGIDPSHAYSPACRAAGP